MFVTPDDLQTLFLADALPLTILDGGFPFRAFLGRQSRSPRIYRETAAFNLQRSLGHRPAHAAFLAPGEDRRMTSK